MIQYKKVADILIFNEQGQLALQLRSARDDSFPAHWDFSAGGGIDTNEEPQTSAEREVLEELGVDVKVELIKQGRYQYPAWDPQFTRDVDMFIFKAVYNGPFKPDPVEVDDVKFFSMDEIKSMIGSGAKFHPEFIIAWNEGLVSSVV